MREVELQSIGYGYYVCAPAGHSGIPAKSLEEAIQNYRDTLEDPDEELEIIGPHYSIELHRGYLRLIGENHY